MVSATGPELALEMELADAEAVGDGLGPTLTAFVPIAADIEFNISGVTLEAKSRGPCHGGYSGEE